MKIRTIGLVLVLLLANWAIGAAAQTAAPEGTKACACVCCQHAKANAVNGGHDHAAATCCANHEKGSADCCASKDGKMDCCKDGSADCCKSGGDCCGGKDAKMCAAKDDKGCCAGGQCKTKSATK